MNIMKKLELNGYIRDAKFLAGLTFEIWLELTKDTIAWIRDEIS